MTREEFNDLEPGSMVKHISGERVFVVTANYGGRVTAVHTVDLTSPVEWELVKLQQWRK